MPAGGSEADPSVRNPSSVARHRSMAGSRPRLRSSAVSRSFAACSRARGTGNGSRSWTTCLSRKAIGYARAPSRPSRSSTMMEPSSCCVRTPRSSSSPMVRPKRLAATPFGQNPLVICFPLDVEVPEDSAREPRGRFLNASRGQKGCGVWPWRVLDEREGENCARAMASKRPVAFGCAGLDVTLAVQRGT